METERVRFFVDLTLAEQWLEQLRNQDHQASA
jgi:hypothetical protein